MIRAIVLICSVLAVSSCANLVGQKQDIYELINEPEKYAGKDVAFDASLVYSRDYMGFSPMDGSETRYLICLASSENTDPAVPPVNFRKLGLGKYLVHVTGKFVLNQEKIPDPEKPVVIITSGCKSKFRIQPYTVVKLPTSAN